MEGIASSDSDLSPPCRKGQNPYTQPRILSHLFLKHAKVESESEYHRADRSSSHATQA